MVPYRAYPPIRHTHGLTHPPLLTHPPNHPTHIPKARLQEASRLSSILSEYDRLVIETHHLKDVAALAHREKDKDVVEECHERLQELEKEVEDLRRGDEEEGGGGVNGSC